MGATANFLLKTGTDDAVGQPRPDVWRRESHARRRLRTASRSARIGMAASAASGALPTACAIRSSRPTKAASSRRRSSARSDGGQLVLVRALSRRQEPVHHADSGDPARHATISAPIRASIRSPRLTTAMRSGASGSTAIPAAARTRISPMAAARRCVSSARTSTMSSATAGRSATSSWPTRGDVDTNALFSGSNPATLYDELYTIPTESRRLRAAGGIGDGHLRRRRRGARRPERHPPGLVVHPQGAREHQQRFPR